MAAVPVVPVAADAVRAAPAVSEEVPAVGMAAPLWAVPRWVTGPRCTIGPRCIITMAVIGVPGPRTAALAAAGPCASSRWASLQQSPCCCSEKNLPSPDGRFFALQCTNDPNTNVAAAISRHKNVKFNFLRRKKQT